MTAFSMKNKPATAAEDSSTPEERAGIYHTPSMETSKKIDALRASWPEGKTYPSEFYHLAVAVEGLRESLPTSGDLWAEQRRRVISAAGAYIRAAELRGHIEVADLLAEYATAALVLCNRK
jgi:hypothetical protein